MNFFNPMGGMQERLVSTAIVLLMVACAIRTAAELLRPVMPFVIALAVLGLVVWLVVGLKRRY